MVVLTEITLAILTFIILLALYQFDEKILDIFLIVFFLFIFAQLKEFSGPATFYALGGLLYLTQRDQIDPEEESRFDKRNPMHFLLMATVGVLLFFVVGILSVNTGFNIITVPQLAVADFVRKFSISFFVVLAFLENRIFISIYEVLNKRINFLVSLFLVAFLFSAFHASPLWGIGTRIWAMTIFALFIAVYDNRLLGMRFLPVDISHGLWNLSVFL